MKMVARGCGASRVAGGIYAECGLGPDGHPIEEYLCDPGRVVKYRDLGISEIGVTAIRDSRSGVVHLWDHVGRTHYPNVADFVEEARQHGISRRLPATLPFDALTADSRLVLMHSRAVITNGQQYADVEPRYRPQQCPNAVGLRHCGRRRETHEAAQPGFGCSRFWWQDVVEEGKPSTGEPIIRTIADTTYRALSRSSGVAPNHATGIFGIFPLTGIMVVRDREGGTHDRALQKVRTVAGIPFGIVDE